MTDYRKVRVPVDIKAGPHKGEDGWERYSHRIRRANPTRASGYETLTFYDPFSVVDWPAPAPRVPLRGACMHLWGSPDWAQELRLIDAAGANCVRMDFNWKDWPHAYNQGQRIDVDGVFNACRSLGLRVIASFLSSDAITAAEFPAYAKAAAKFCQLYAVGLAALEVWNEPNEPESDGEPHMAPAEYAQLVKATYPAVKAAAPNVPVIVGSLARVDEKAVNWLGQALAAGMPVADGFALHPYSSKWPVSTVGTALDALGLKTLQQMKPGVPQWITEFGCSTVSKTVDPNYSVSEAQQGLYIAEAWENVDPLPFVKAATLYNCVENGDRPPTKPSDDSIWGRWGVVRRDWTLKPGYQALKAGITR